MKVRPSVKPICEKCKIIKETPVGTLRRFSLRKRQSVVE